MCVYLFYIHKCICVQGAIEVTIYDRVRGPDGQSKVNHVGTTTLSVSEVLLLLLPTPFSTPCASQTKPCMQTDSHTHILT